MGDSLFIILFIEENALKLAGFNELRAGVMALKQGYGKI
jgi:hypothetical protein